MCCPATPADNLGDAAQRGGVEVSPSPVYGARLLSGLRVIPSRGFKSRHLRHPYFRSCQALVGV